MELAESITTSLSDRSTEVSLDQFRHLLNLALASLTLPTSPGTTNTTAELTLQEKELLAALMTVLVESVSRRLSPMSAVASLPISEDQAQLLSTALTEQGPALRRCLHLIGPARRHLLDVDWRINYMVKSSNIERDADCQILLRLHTESPAGLPSNGDKCGGVNQLVCTPNQLHDLITKIREAVRNLERIADNDL